MAGNKNDEFMRRKSVNDANYDSYLKDVYNQIVNEAERQSIE